MVARKLVDAMLRGETQERVDELSCAQLAKALVDGRDLNGVFRLFGGMQQQNIQIKEGRVYSTLLLGCAEYTALSLGKRVHQHINSNTDTHRHATDIVLQTALLNMYGKSGSLDDARAVFRALLHHHGWSRLPVEIWSAMIHAKGLHGNANVALDLFSKMTEAGVVPNHITFVYLLNACSHDNMPTVATELLQKMSSQFGVTPTVELQLCGGRPCEVWPHQGGRRGDRQHGERWCVSRCHHLECPAVCLQMA